MDDDLAAGTVALVLGTDFNGVGQPVTVAAPTTDPVVPDSYVNPERTAADTSCIN